MEIYNTEEQQVEAIKRFFREHGLSMAAGILIGLGGLYGFREYQAAQLEAQEAQSAAYAVLVDKAAAEGADKKAWLTDAQKFIADHKDSSYSHLTALMAAKEAVVLKDYATAEQQLEAVAKGSKVPEVIAVAQLRLARVQAEQAKYKEALATLGATMPAAFAAQQNELKGDVLLKTGDEAAALSAYKAAQAGAEAGKNPLLDVKLNELAHVAG